MNMDHHLSVRTGLVLLAIISGNLADISPSCLDCLSKANPVPPDQSCLTFGGDTFCGPFRISERFFTECSQLFTPDSGLEKFRDCTLDYGCAARCVEVQHNIQGTNCLNNIRRWKPDYQELICADYGRIHYAGSHVCAQQDDSPGVATYLQNMTNNCGCKTVFGTCEPSTTTTPSKKLDSQQLVIYVVPAVCAVVLVGVVFALTLTVCRYVKRKQRSRRAASEAAAAARIREGKMDKGKERSAAQSASGPNRSSQYNSYIATPQSVSGSGSGQPRAQVTANGVSSAAAETDDYISPSGKLSSATPFALADLTSHMVTLTTDSKQQPTDDSEIYHQAAPARITVADEDAASLGEPADKYLYLNSNDPPKAFDDMYVNMVEQKGADATGKSSRSKAPLPAPRSLDPMEERTGLSRAPTGLYVEDVEVSDDWFSGRDSEQHYNNV